MKFLLCSEEGRRSSEGGLKSIAAKQLTRQISVVKSKGRAVASTPVYLRAWLCREAKVQLQVFPRMLSSQLIKVLCGQESEMLGFPLISTMSHFK